ncbi:nesprin-3-like [Megalops cyprinoides]|uniref:nesprin-3-like n=1 Tax=Megalops cyprinoides TaxID=118141 RepID=UPI0018646B14|nr:nesprin-3-like [Megalops cyprinoides]
MTQEERDAFLQSLESALSWIKAVQERLRANDNTQGPRSALETRLRETKAIRESEHEGWMKVDMAMVAAENLLRSSDEEVKSQTNSRLKELKASWEETSTYITHCHSRIEWVWLHWGEYLRAQEEFEAWLMRMQRALGPHPELQLGAREKLWHLEHHNVLLADARAQEPLLERLLDEAAALHDRTEDPSLAPEARERLQDAYNQIKDRAEERVLLLQKISEEHRLFDCSVHKFWAWLDSTTEELTRYRDFHDALKNTFSPRLTEDTTEHPRHSLGTGDASQNVVHPLHEDVTHKKITQLPHTEDTAIKVLHPQHPKDSPKMFRPQHRKDTPESVLCALQALCERVDSEEKTLRHLKGLAESVKANTSPKGSETVTQEMERLWVSWEGLRQRLLLEQERLRTTHRTQAEYTSCSEKLRADTSRLRLHLKELNQQLESGEKMEEEKVLWRKYMDVRRALSEEEPHVEQLKAQLTELFRLSPSTTPVTDQVLTVLKEYQRVKGNAFRLWMEKDTALRQALLDPLRGFSRWSQQVTQILEASEEVSAASNIPQLVQNMEKLLKDSLQLKERLSQLQVQEDLLSSVFGPEKADSLGEELTTAVREREKQHDLLCQRKSHLQGLLLNMKNFEEAYETFVKRLHLIRERFITMDKLQPDIHAKTALSDQLMMILKDLEESEPHLTTLQNLASSNPADRHKVSQLYAEWRDLCKDVRVRVDESEQNVADHRGFQEGLLDMEKWLLEMRQRLESFCSRSGEWSLENRHKKAERALGEFPERELELRRVEAQGQGVLAQTSEEGKGPILQDLQHLRDSWESLHMLSLNLYRLLNGDGVAGADVTGEVDGQIGTNKHMGLGETEENIRASEPEQGSDYSGGTSGRQRFGTGGEGEQVRQGGGVGAGTEQGSRVEEGVEEVLGTERKGVSIGQGVKAEAGLGSGGKGVVAGEGVRTGEKLSSGGKGLSVGQGARAEEGLESGCEGTGEEQPVSFGSTGAGDEGMYLKQGVRAEAGVGAGGEGVGQGFRAEGGVGAGDENMGLGQSVRAKGGVKARGKKKGTGQASWHEWGISTEGESMGLGPDVRAKGELGDGSESMDTEKVVRAEGAFGGEGEGVSVGQSVRGDVKGGLGTKDQEIHVKEGTNSGWVFGTGNEGMEDGRDLKRKEGLEVGCQSMGLGQEGKVEGSLGPGRQHKPGSVLEQRRSPGGGQNTPQSDTEKSLRGEEPDDSRFKSGIEEVDLGGRHSHSYAKDQTEGTIQQTDRGGTHGTATSQWGSFSKERGTAAGETSPSPGLAGTSVERLSQHTQAGHEETDPQGDRADLQKEFEAWLQTENTKLCRILSRKRAVTAEELRLRQQELEELRSRVGWGQSRLQLLMSRVGAGEHNPGLEELRYRWILYKSKLKGVGDLAARLRHKDVSALHQEPLRTDKTRSGLLQRACCAALPLQLLLLSLLLLAFLLPLTDEGASCSLANNFARSFKLMLRYEGPPPT